MSEEIGDKFGDELLDQSDKNKYYGVAWDYSEDTYRGTGLLAKVSKYEDVENIMFIHNSIEKQPDGSFKVSKIYYRRQHIGSEIIMEISDLPLVGFNLIHPTLAIGVLGTIVLGIYKSLKKEVEREEGKKK